MVSLIIFPSLIKVFSLGILIIEMIIGEITYWTVADIFHGKYPLLLEGWKKLQLEPKERPTISQIIFFFK